MDYIRFHCPSCNNLLVVPPEAAEMSGPCPYCNTLIEGPNHRPAIQLLNQPSTAQLATSATPSTHTHSVHSIPEQAAAPAPTITPDPAQLSDVPQPLTTPQPPQEPPSQTEISPNQPPNEAQVEAPAQHPLQPHPPRGLSFPQATLLCFISAAAFFIMGFYLGKTGSNSWQDILKHADPETVRTEEIESPTPAPIAPQVTASQRPLEPASNTLPPLESISSASARASLEAFLNAETWSARSAYALDPTNPELLAKMEAAAQSYGDHAIEVESIILQSDGPDQKVFWIKTQKNARPFSAILIREEQNWRVDWSAFAEFYYDRLNSFAIGEAGPMKGRFRVLLKAAPGETSPLSPARCLIMAPQSVIAYQVNSAAGSSARRELAEMLQAYLQAEPETYHELMASAGIPLIVEISRNGAVNPTLTLDRIAASGWAPLPPEELKKSSSSFY